MKPAIIAVSMFALLSLEGCAAQPVNWSDPQETSNRIEIKRDDFKKTLSYTGPNCAPTPREDTLLIRAWETGDKETEYQIYVADEYTYEIMRGGVGWRFYTVAHDRDGNELPTVQISRAPNWCGRYVCNYVEVVGINVTRQYLEERKDRAVDLKISGKGGAEVVSIPAAYIQALLQKVV